MKTDESDEYVNEQSLAEDSASSNRLLVDRPSALCHQPVHCSRDSSEQLASDSRHASAATTLESSSLLSYNPVMPRPNVVL